MIKRYGANVSPCSTLTTMSKYSMSPSGERTVTFVFLYGHLPPITKTIKFRRTRHVGHCWRGKDKLISDILLWTSSHGQAKTGRPTWTYIQQLYVDKVVALKTCRKQWTIKKGVEKRLGIFVLMARQDYIYILSSTDRSVSFYQNSSVWLDGISP